MRQSRNDSGVVDGAQLGSWIAAVGRDRFVGYFRVLPVGELRLGVADPSFVESESSILHGLLGWV